MESLKVFSGNVIEAGAVQQLLNDNQIGTWVRNSESTAIFGQGLSGESVEIYIESQQEEKAKFVLESNDYYQ